MRIVYALKTRINYLKIQVVAYLTSLQTMSILNTSRLNLGDPQWDLIDPTPNVHALFVQFNAKFFWGKLVTVSVRWSKRMYSCAGICRYEARGGLCDIGLSEPLLKLRPRKDLVETLLHEMIHAYLFVVERDRDREGHGPNFKKHMYRINNEANINITVYHSFHDEVDLYKVHWWRCNGICQTKAPHFGIVRRSYNRAPSPNDYWWAQHQQMCGGQFVKFKEPEKNKKVAKENRPKENIGKYFETIPNIKTIKDITPTSNKDKIVTDEKPTNLIWPGNGNILRDRTSSVTSDVTQTVRNHWANVDLTTGNKRKSTSAIESSAPPTKINKTDAGFPTKVKPPDNFTLDDAKSLLKDIYGTNVNLPEKKYGEIFSPPSKTSKAPAVVEIPTVDYPTVVIDPTELVECMLCGKKVESTDINEHLDVCLKEVPKKDVLIAETNAELVECPSCGKQIDSFDINEHLDECLRQDPVNTTVKAERQDCPICNKPVIESLEEHLATCINQFEHEFPSTSKATVIDSVCLDDEDDFNDSETSNSTGSMLPCPCCMKMVEKDSMNKHIDECLNKIYLGFENEDDN